MFALDADLTDTAVIVRYMAVFHRLFAANIRYIENGDKPGMLLGGYLANFLHNVPRMLWYCDPQAWHSPDHMELLNQGFVQRLSEENAPQRLVAASQSILSSTGTAVELQLRNDMTDVSLAPLPKMHRYLYWLYEACLSLRSMMNVSPPPHVWEELEQAWSEQSEWAEAAASHNLIVASVLLPIPQALVQWPQFDEGRFYNGALRAAEIPQKADREAWLQYLDKSTNAYLL